MAGAPTSSVTNEGLRHRSAGSAFPCYGDDRIPMVRGQGARLWDADGNEYLDMLAGIAVACLGHAHPVIRDALTRQADLLVHCSNKFIIEPQVRLAEWLCERCFAERAFFANSGTEAVEAALKLARRAAYLRGEKDRVEFVSFEGSFHGRTFGSVSVTAQPKYQEGYQPLLPGAVSVPFGDLDALAGAMSSRTAAVILEPIQGEGGVRPFAPEFLQEVAALCRDRGALLILDEVQCGMGRTGKLFAHEHAGVTPDILVLAKALGGGVPIGAILARRELAECFTNGSHGSTFGGNPLACAVALAVCETIEREGLIQRAETVGAYFKQQLVTLCQFDRVREVRGMGLMLGLGMESGAKELYKFLLKKRIIANAVGDHTIRLTPPLIITESDVDTCVSAMRQWLECEPLTD